MKYLFFICVDPSADPYDPALDNIHDWVAEMDGRGARLEGHQLVEPNQAVTVKRRGGETLVADGPFAETKEWIAGYDLFECRDLDDAIACAAKHPMARFGRIEIRPVE